jgi:hypothetical protein
LTRVVAIVIAVAVTAAPLRRAGRAHDVATAARAAARGDHFLRDAVPSAGFARQPEDTTDDFFLPNEKDTSDLLWEVAAWVIGAAIVAYFIIKVFLEDEPDDTDNGSQPKPDPF